jgi:predicted permease
MPPIARLRSLSRNLLNRNRVERDLDDEVRAAFEMLIDERLAAGMTRAEAERAATIALGRVESIKTQVRDERAGALWDGLLQDARHGTRLLWQNPLFTLTAALSLAICIGANTTVFSIANRLLFREAAGVIDPERLVDVVLTRADGRFAEPTLVYRQYVELRARVTTLEGLYGYQLDIQPVSFGAPEGAERIFSTFVTSNYFGVLGVHPALGRLFGPQDAEEAGGSDAVVLGHGFWMRRFNGDPDVVGQPIRINGQPLTIVGVTPEEFRGLSLVVADIWVPTSVAARLSNESLRMAVGGRLKSGVSIRQAAAEMDAIGRAMRGNGPPPPPAIGGFREAGGRGSFRAVPASPIPQVVRVPVSAFLALLLGIVSLVLIVACANVSGVLLARAVARRREIAVRLALGAGRARLIRQLLTETLLVFALGGAAGLALARVMTSLLVLALPPLPVPVDTALPLDYRVVAFTTLVSLVAAVLSGLVPAFRASRADVVSALKADSQGASDRLRLRSVFVVAQIAFSILLVVGAGLFARALHRSGSVDLGFDGHGVEVATLELTLSGHTGSTGPFVVEELLDRVRAIPRVEAASVATLLPLGGQRRVGGIAVPGVEPPDGQPLFEPNWNVVGPGYLATLRIPLLAGRDFTAADRAGAELVAIVSAAAARQYWPGQEAVGRQLNWHRMPRLIARNPADLRPEPPLRLSVVGVVGDIRPGGPAPAQVYVPFQQHYQSDVVVVARSRDGQRLTAEIRDAVAGLDANLPILAASRLVDQATPVLLQLRVAAWVSAGVGAIALLLAAIGIYGVTAYAVTRRTREFGIRIAMGARHADVVRMVLWQGMACVGIGGAIGFALAAAASRLLSRLLFGIPALDPVTFGGVAVLFACVGLLACVVPLRRAIRINAAEALRYE